jgi:hypothetical protein
MEQHCAVIRSTILGSTVEIIQIMEKFDSNMLMKLTPIHDIEIAKYIIGTGVDYSSYINSHILNADDLINILPHAHNKSTLLNQAMWVAINCKDINYINTLKTKYNCTISQAQFIAAVQNGDFDIIHNIYNPDTHPPYEHSYCDQNKNVIDFIRDINHTWVLCPYIKYKRLYETHI